MSFEIKEMKASEEKKVLSVTVETVKTIKVGGNYRLNSSYGMDFSDVPNVVKVSNLILDKDVSYSEQDDISNQIREYKRMTCCNLKGLERQLEAMRLSKTVWVVFGMSDWNVLPLEEFVDHISIV